MVEIISRVIEGQRINIEGLLDKDELLERAKVVWAEKNGVDPKDVKEIKKYQFVLEPQFSVNSDGRLVMRFKPVFIILEIEFKRKVEKYGKDASVVDRVELQDYDVLIVLEGYVAKELWKFMGKIRYLPWGDRHDY